MTQKPSSQAHPDSVDVRENSVLFALNELQALERSRVEKEEQLATETANAKAQQEAQRIRESQRQAEAKEIEARLRLESAFEERADAIRGSVEKELAEKSQQLLRLTAELERVRADREQIHQRIIGLSAPSPRPGNHRLIYLMGGISLLTAAIAAMIAIRAPAAPTHSEPEQITVAAPEVAQPVPIIAEADPSALVPEESAAVETEPEVTATPRPRPRPRPQGRVPMEPTGSSGVLDFDRCGDDILCGLNQD